VKYGYTKIVDLVTDKDVFTDGPYKGKKIRTHFKKLISAKEFKESTNEYEVIIAIGMYKEGSDWPLADRSIIIGHRGSFVELVQLVGRPTRDVLGKANAEIDLILTFGVKGKTAEEQKEHINDYIKSIMFTYLYNVACTPIKLYKAVKGGQPLAVKNWFEEYFPDMDSQNEVCALAITLLTKLRVANPYATVKEIWKEFASKSVSMLKGLNVPNHYEEVAKYIWSMLVHNAQPKKNVGVVPFSSNLLGPGTTDPLSGILSYTTQFGVDNYTKLRDALSPVETIELWLGQAIAARKAGLL
jgi:hypothetical protein